MKRDHSAATLGLLLSISLMLPDYVFAAKPVPVDMATQAELDAAIATVNSKINNVTPPVRAIGNVLPDNSIVFWIDETGQHGLAAQPFDDAPSNWYVAKEVVENHGLGWRLPTKHELNLLYLQKDIVGGFVNGYYWSSTEFDGSAAWRQDFNDGYQDCCHSAKDTSNNMRAVRGF